MSLARRKTPEQEAAAQRHPATADLVEALTAASVDKWPTIVSEALVTVVLDTEFDLLSELLKGGNPEGLVDRARAKVREISEMLSRQEAATYTPEEQLDMARAELNGVRRLARKEQTQSPSFVRTPPMRTTKAMLDRVKKIKPLVDDAEEQETWYRNHYECYGCGYAWTDDWTAMCDDDCPLCGAGGCSPVRSEVIPPPPFSKED